LARRRQVVAAHSQVARRHRHHRPAVTLFWEEPSSVSVDSSESLHQQQRSVTQSRYIEATVNGVIIASNYAPNGNPQPGPKFDYKLAWLKRLFGHAAELYVAGRQSY
jgi:exonuclease III